MAPAVLIAAEGPPGPVRPPGAAAPGQPPEQHPALPPARPERARPGFGPVLGPSAWQELVLEDHEGAAGHVVQPGRRSMDSSDLLGQPLATHVEIHARDQHAELAIATTNNKNLKDQNLKHVARAFF